MTTHQKTNYHHGDLKNALIEAGLKVLARDGVTALSLRRVAREAGVSHNAPYTYFTDKDALLSGIAEQGFNQLGEAMDEVIANTESGTLARLQGLGTAYFTFALTHAQAFRLMFADLPLNTHVRLGKTAYATFARLHDAVIACQQSNVLKQEDAMLVALSVWTTMHGLANLLVTGRANSMTRGLSDEALAKVLLHSLFEGITT